MARVENMTDAELIALYNQDKNTLVLNDLFKRYIDIGFRTAMRYMRNQSDAEDVLQLVFIQFLKSIPSFDEGASTIKPWLMKMIVNTSLNKLKEEKRRSQRQQKVASQRFAEYQDESELEKDIEDREALKNKLHGYVDSLPEKYKSPIWLVLYEGLSYPEAASILSLPEKTVRTQVSRGLDRLRQVFMKLGSALSVTLIANLLMDTKLEAAPAEVINSLGSNRLLDSMKASQQSGRIGASIPSSSGMVLKYIGLILASMVAVVSIYYYNSINKSNLLPDKITSESRDLGIFIDFDKLGDFEKYYYHGKYKYSVDGGLNQSGSMEALDNLILRVPVEKKQLPLKIEFRWNIKTKVSANRKELSVTFGSWEGKGKFSLFNPGMSYDDRIQNEYLIDEDKNWIHSVIYVTENSVEYVLNGKRRSLEVFKQRGFSKYLFIRIGDDFKIDDLRIETIEKMLIPKVSDVIELNEIFLSHDLNASDKKRKIQEFLGKNTYVKHSKVSDCQLGEIDKFLKIIKQ